MIFGARSVLKIKRCVVAPLREIHLREESLNRHQQIAHNKCQNRQQQKLHESGQRNGHYQQRQQTQHDHVNDVNGVGIPVEQIHQPVRLVQAEPEAVEHHVQKTEHG